MLKLVNIIKDYRMADDVVHAVKGISLNFRKSEFVSILGPSGCGKTTLLNIIGGLDQYTDGDLIINDKSTKEFKSRDWDAYRNRSIGFVFQSYNLIPHLNVLQNVELALTISGVSRSKKKKLAAQALERVGLGNQLKKKPNQMSGGQMQRVAIARAIVNDPEIILADEPTGALDTKTSEQVMDLLQEIADNRLVIMVTHNPELAQRYSTRIIELMDGEVVADSNPYDGMPTMIAPVTAVSDDATPIEEYIHESESAPESAPEPAPEPAPKVPEKKSKNSKNKKGKKPVPDIEEATSTTEDAENAPAEAERAAAVSAPTEDGSPSDAESAPAEEKFVASVTAEKPVPVRKRSGKPKRERKERTSMSFLTALSLSARNLIAKRTRTFLTAFAGSIGIIGIALVLSLSNGFDIYMGELEGSILSSMPLTINSMALDIDVNELMNMQVQTGSTDGEAFPDTDYVTPYQPSGLISGITFGANVLTKEYVQYVQKVDKTLLNSVRYTYSIEMPLLVKDDSGKVSHIASGSQVMGVSLGDPIGWQELLWDNFMQDQFDVIAGGYPGSDAGNSLLREYIGSDAYDALDADGRKARQAVLIISSYNTIDREILETLGLKLKETDDGGYLPVDFDDILGTDIVVASNDNYYNTKNVGYTFDTNGDSVVDENDAFQTVSINENYEDYYDDPDNVEVRIVGVLRMKSDLLAPLLQNGVAYTQELTQLCLQKADGSEIVRLQKEYDGINIRTGKSFDMDFSAIVQLFSSVGMSERSVVELFKDLLSGDSDMELPSIGGIDFGDMLDKIDPEELEDCETISELFDLLKESFNLDNDTIELILRMVVGLINKELGTSISANSLITLLNSAYETALQAIGGADDDGFHMPTGIYIYPTDFANKDIVCAYLDEWNENNPSMSVTYTDYAGTISQLLSQVVDIVSYILIAFAAISLVVSSVMIAIITYVSVLERTTEIGVLRSIGARKLDISNLFNAETAIIGASAGILGVFLAWIIDFPINAWIASLATQAPPNFAVLNPLHALLLVVLSIVLTVISGLVPAIAAARKDPVKALRSAG